VIGAAELGDRLSSLLQEGGAAHDGEEFDDEAPVIRMINAILQEAVSRKASDIHLEPYEQESVVRFRVDGLLRDVAHPPRTLHAALISRIKVMAQLDIAEKRLPQDGRMTVRGGSGLLDIRVSTLPTGSGERAVLRLLDKGQARLSLEALGMAQDTLHTVQQLIERPHGIVLVTGPTGSGKTTTLYAALSRLDAGSRNIMTVEDPIEYDMPGVSQTQVHPKIGLSFAQSLRSILRQDPDVIMIGEIRDLETAQIAIQASLTGHLVLATLHTNDAPSAVTRLLDMGVESFLLSSSLVGVMAQRLVRQTCKACGGAGCAACDATGFKGRLGIFELLVMDDGLRTAVKDRQDASQIRRLAAGQGFRSLREDGARLVGLGLTTEAEVARVTELGDLE
jgi:general secretion pathway protein E